MRKEFLENLGEKWYLREFDFFPEQVKNHHAFDFISSKMWKLEGVNFKLYNSKEEALEEAKRIRELLGLKDFVL